MLVTTCLKKKIRQVFLKFYSKRRCVDKLVGSIQTDTCIHMYRQKTEKISMQNVDSGYIEMVGL